MSRLVLKLWFGHFKCCVIFLFYSMPDLTMKIQAAAVVGSVKATILADGHNISNWDGIIHSDLILNLLSLVECRIQARCIAILKEVCFRRRSEVILFATTVFTGSGVRIGNFHQKLLVQTTSYCYGDFCFSFSSTALTWVLHCAVSRAMKSNCCHR